ncbi:ATP-binding protein [Chitinispirillales bacterium ANBcel5]|uniref:chemotaxis protein CheA n=1 Tax=Cellulosispirillum alkaliphilum TaxID=3039283 RepID=UPI002A563A09|nr:ATP-binding protein [Chitinispirillales bacterium ANBcel5]
MNSDVNESIDPDLKVEFIDESIDGLNEISDLLVQLESDPGNIDIIQSVFRPVHSIKGNSAYFGLLQIKKLAHETENLLDLIRNGALTAQSWMISILLKSIDELRAMFERVRDNNNEVISENEFSTLIEKIKEAANIEKIDEEKIWKDIFEQSKRVRKEGNLDKENLLLLLDRIDKLAQCNTFAQKIFSETDTENKNDNTIDEKNSTIEQLLNDISDPDKMKSQLLKILSHYKESKPLVESIVLEIVSEIDLFINSVGIDDPIAKESIMGHLEKLELVLNEQDTTPKTLENTSNKSNTHNSPTAKTMRIPEESIDGFLSYVGNLITIGEMYQHIYKKMSQKKSLYEMTTEFRRVNEAFSDLSLSLQSSIMNIRKMPIGIILQKAPRIIRDIATENNKKINTIINGDHIKVDKSIIGNIEAPLVHMLRNAADHGIESIEERKLLQKDYTGRIEINVSENTEELMIEIKDDGKGLNLKELKEKAIETGLINENDELTENDIIDLLFESGISTSKEITDVSGRGVGMDVVKRSIEEIGGKIGVLSKPGEGSSFTITLPKTVSTQILSGFVIVVDGCRYVLPMERIVRSFKVTSEKNLIKIQNKGICVKDSESIIPVFPLRELFYGDFYKEYLKGIMVVVEGKRELISLYVDSIDGVRQVVVKDIEGLSCTNGCFNGGAVMGDGTVAMVIDIDQLVEFIDYNSIVSQNVVG